MVKHKVSELEGVLLDAAVAMAEGMQFRIQEVMSSDFRSRRDMCCVAKHQERARRLDDFKTIFQPSSAWNDAGPIIERERIAVWAYGNGWAAAHPVCGDSAHYYDTNHGIIDASPLAPDGQTPLIAAMRAYVASKFGETVELQADSPCRKD